MAHNFWLRGGWTESYKGLKVDKPKIRTKTISRVKKLGNIFVSISGLLVTFWFDKNIFILFEINSGP